MNKELAVVICHFNWCNFYTPTRNLHRFLRQMGIANVPVYGIELSLTGEFETNEMPNWKQIKVTKENVCFQKEACINLVVKSLPSHITKVAWIDHDFMFTNADWYNQASEALDKYKVIQLFSEYVPTDIFGRKIRSMISTAKSYAIHNKRSNARGCAWAARRELWDNGGLYPFSFLGGGDSLFAHMIFGGMKDDKLYYVSGIHGNLKFEPFLNWKNSILTYVGAKDVFYINGEIIHEWHGEHDGRKYATRYDIIKGMNLSKTVSLDHNELVKIDNISEQLRGNIMTYFKERNEDG